MEFTNGIPEEDVTAVITGAEVAKLFPKKENNRINTLTPCVRLMRNISYDFKRIWLDQ